MLNLGTFCLASSPTSLCSDGTSAANEIIGHAENQWTVSANVTQGDIIELNFIPGMNWSHGTFDVNDRYPGFGLLYVGTNFTIQKVGDTLFVFTLGILVNQTSPLFVLDINVTANNGAFDSSPFYNSNSNSYSQAGGIAQSSGNCTLNVISPWPSRTDPPIQLILLRVWS